MKTVKPDSRELRKLRRAYGSPPGELTQARLAELAFGDAELARQIGRIESGKDRVRLHTLACVLQVVLRLETEQEALDAVWDYIELDEVGGDRPEDWLAYAVRLDQNGDTGAAIQLSRTILRFVEPPHPEGVQTAIRLATFYDHAQQWEQALAVLDKLLNDEDLLDETPDATSWVRYQRGLIRRRLAEDLMARAHGRIGTATAALLRSARIELEDVRSTGPKHVQVAAEHQIAVLDLIAGDFARAIVGFQSCLLQRLDSKRVPGISTPGDFRSAYEHRRIGQCLALLGREQDECRAAFEEARTLAAGQERLLGEIRRDALALDLATDPPLGG